jgi:ribosomal protein S18 acetylase RimI-like enzyme
VRPVLESDVWLARQLGKPVLRVQLESVSDAPAAIANLTHESDWKSGQFYYASVPCDDTACIQELINLGFYWAETSIGLRCNLGEAPQVNDRAVRSAVAVDRDAVARIAHNSFKISRFHSDPQIPDSIAGTIKKEWVSNFFNGKRGTELLVADAEQKPVGFLLLIESGAEVAIDLIAVDASVSGKGVASALIRSAMNRYSHCDAITVTTELRNTSALRLYRRLGFRIVSDRHVFHFHS